LFVEHFALLAGERGLVVVSPDAGGVKRVEDFRLALSARLGRPVDNAFVEKYRSAGIVSGHAVVGEVSGKTAIILDDLLSSGTTIARAAQACKERGALSVYAGATHGVFSNKASENLSGPALTGIAITNSVVPSSIAVDGFLRKLTVIDASPLIAAAIQRMHSGGSLVELLGS
jgi:ribose-phosphate pyrophosphokinase